MAAPTLVYGRIPRRANSIRPLGRPLRGSQGAACLPLWGVAERSEFNFSSLPVAMCPHLRWHGASRDGSGFLIIPEGDTIILHSAF